MVWLVRGDNQYRVIQELENESDRSAIIIGSSIVETHLTAALKSNLHHNPKIFEELFNPGRAIGDFGTKIQLGHVLGLYKISSYNDLKIIRRLRNDFAHNLDYKGFDDQKVKNRIQNIKITDEYVGSSVHEILHQANKPNLNLIVYDTPPQDTRHKFLLACQLFGMLLSAQSDQAVIPQPRPYGF